ncbi:MAG TPA: efflux RND transporter periplasmic adaptor subunit [Puia sp.]|jgi:membrane fusion protein (multidrug efflux system)|nr:efflux RND transporter periplasmic adaptor subunit [Puia sp.]
MYKALPLTLLLIAAFGCRNTTQNQDPPAAPPPAQAYPVFAATTHTAVLRSEYPATLQGLRDIEIRPKIDGYIEQIYIDEGATVKKGQLLFKIRAPQYEQDVKNALAAINSAEADVNTAKLQVEKTKPLVDRQIISEYELRSAEDALKVKEAALLQAKTSLANAQTNLSYTTITSPGDGVAGMIPYKLGSLVTSTTASPLTMISNISKVFAYFSMNEKQLLDFSRQYKGTTAQEKLKQMPPVTLILSDGTEYPEKGRVETIGGMINAGTGAATFRATFPNPVGLIRSGGSAVVAIPVTIANALLIPQQSTYELQGKRFVYRVDGNKVTSVEISTMTMPAGQYFVVTGGLKAGDKIVFETATPIADGTSIKPEMQPESQIYKDLK